MGFSISLVYSYKGVNKDYFNGHSYGFGNEILGQAAIVEKLNFKKQIIDIGLTLRYRHQDVDEFNEVVLPNTGGQFLFLTPGITYYFTPRLSGSMSGDIPVYARIEGTQLAPTYRLNIGLFLIINRKQSIDHLID